MATRDAARSKSRSRPVGGTQRPRPRIGSSLDSWLREEGIYEQTTSRAIKRVVARQLQAAMTAQNVSKVEMARRMGSSRSALDRLLDPDNDSVTLGTLRKAAAAVGLEVRLELA
jgi:antitoxin HicB